MIGETLGHYEITALLGKGGMGEVYRARDTRLDREVALKILPTEKAGDLERIQRLEREAKAVAALNHTNIVTIHSVEEVDERRFLTMEFVEGQTLSDLIPPDGMTLERFFELAIPLADALSADEAFISGASSYVLPVREIDGQSLGSEVPGPVTRRMREIYLEFVRASLI